ncbi:MAG: hypothetical protein ACPG4T_04600 [Nannocystaceae bacterium]
MSSRSGYSDDGWGSREERWQGIRYRGAVASALRGKRGQKFLRDLIEALDAMPVKKLISGGPVTPDGCCAMGAVMLLRGLEVSSQYDSLAAQLAEPLDIAEAMAQEIAFENDGDLDYIKSDADRWTKMRRWAEGNLND